MTTLRMLEPPNREWYVNTYTTSRLRVNYLCIFLHNTVDKLAFYMYVFLIYGCLQKHCLRLICLSSIVHTMAREMDMMVPMFRSAMPLEW